MIQLLQFFHDCITAQPNKEPTHLAHAKLFGRTTLENKTNCEEGVVFKEHVARRSSLNTGQIYRPESMLAHPREL